MTPSLTPAHLATIEEMIRDANSTWPDLEMLNSEREAMVALLEWCREAMAEHRETISGCGLCHGTGQARWGSCGPCPQCARARALLANFPEVKDNG